MIGLIARAMRDLMPSTDALPGIADTEITSFLRAMRREASPLYWLGLQLGALVYMITPLLTLGVPLPAFALPVRLRDLHAQRIVGSKLYSVRQAVFLVRLSAGMCWGRDPLVRERFALAPYAPDPGSFRTR